MHSIAVWWSYHSPDRFLYYCLNPARLLSLEWTTVLYDCEFHMLRCWKALQFHWMSSVHNVLNYQNIKKALILYFIVKFFIISWYIYLLYLMTVPNQLTWYWFSLRLYEFGFLSNNVIFKRCLSLQVWNSVIFESKNHLLMIPQRANNSKI